MLCAPIDASRICGKEWSPPKHSNGAEDQEATSCDAPAATSKPSHLPAAMSK